MLSKDFLELKLRKSNSTHLLLLTPYSTHMRVSHHVSLSYFTMNSNRPLLLTHISPISSFLYSYQVSPGSRSGASPATLALSHASPISWHGTVQGLGEHRSGRLLLNTPAASTAGLCCSDTRIRIPVRDMGILRYAIFSKTRIWGYANICKK